MIPLLLKKERLSICYIRPPPKLSIKDGMARLKLIFNIVSEVMEICK
jgi:hypothetical protein